MSNANIKRQVKLKATIEEFLEPLLNRISVARGPNNEIVNNMRISIEKTKDILERRKKWNNELMRIFGDIERQIECCQKIMGPHNECTSSTDEQSLQNSSTEEQSLQQNSLTEEENNESIWTKLMDNFNKLLDESGVNQSIVRTTAQQEAGGPSNTSDQVDDDDRNDAEEKLQEFEKKLNEQQRIWLYSLGSFPLNKKLKKKLLVRWWIGLGQVPLEGNVQSTNLQLVQQSRMRCFKSILRCVHTNSKKRSHVEHPNTTVKAVEKLAENFFDDLVQQEILEPRCREHNKVINQCTIKPTIHRQLSDILSSDVHLKARAFLNVEKYINSKSVLGDNKDLNVVHLGRWHCTDLDNNNRDEEVVSYEPQDHIEVDGTDFLKKLGESVIFLNLSGISMIDKLPETIGKLKNLRILDLRACHNLLKLPDKPQSKYLRLKLHWFNNLTYLDISECYLLNHMPKWICELSNLEVFKGFVAGTEGKKMQSCRLRDLSKLMKLRKLSIRIIKPLDFEDARGLESMWWLSILTISWSINKHNNDEDVDWTILFPKKLEKLDLRCYPEADAAKLLNPQVLQELKRLYIRGGKIAKIANNSFWTIKIVRLRFLDFLEIHWYELNRIFPELKHVEYKRCLKLEDFPNKGSWNAEKDGPFPKCHGVDSTRVEMKIISNNVVPVEGHEQKIMLELTGGDSITDGPGLTLVTILDVSKSMDEGDDNKIENLKLAMLFVINKLRSVDRLAIVTFSDMAETIWPLQKITETSRWKLEHLVKNLTADEKRDAHIISGLSKGLNILKHTQNSTQDYVALMFVLGDSFSYMNPRYLPNIPNNVAVHTFGLGSRHNEQILWVIASQSRGGTYSEVRNSENLIKAFAVCLAGLLTVLVQDLTLTLKPIKGSTIKDVSAGRYSPVDKYDVGSVTIKFGDLYRGEIRKVLVKVYCSYTDEEGDKEVLKVSHSYKLSGNLFMASPGVISLRRSRTVSVDQLQALPEVLAEETRAEIAVMDRTAFELLIYNEEKCRELSREYKKINLHETNELLESMSVLDELSKKSGVSESSRNLISKFVHSFHISHRIQRAAARGDDMEKWLTFATPAMLNFLREAKEFSADPTMSPTPVGVDGRCQSLQS